MTMKHIAITATIVVPILAAGLSGCVASTHGTSTNSRNSGSAWSETTPTSSTPVAAPPTPADFAVGVIITEQKCFGSAGCNYRYTINPQYVSAKSLPEKTTVVFTVTGGEQDQVGNFTIDADGTATFDRETSISGEENANLRATVTQVIPGR
jgi:hypothetical protein